MTIIKVKPTTSSQRHYKKIDYKVLCKVKPIKNKTKGILQKGGRNNRGKITVYTKGGGHKRKYRLLDNKFKEKGGYVQNIEYDPNRSAFIARIKNDDTKKEFYILSPEGLNLSQKIEIGPSSKIEIGNSLPLSKIPVGTSIYNIELKPGKGAQLIKSAGSVGQYVQKIIPYARIKLPSGIHRLISLDCMATIGNVSNVDYKNRQLGKAGRSRWLNKRPSVRGVAMNPIDHPHGGGEGKSSGGRPSVTPWGRPTKGQPTRSVKLKNKLILQNFKRK